MKPEDRLKDIVSRHLDVRASDGTFARMRDIVLGAHESSRETESATTPIIARRKIMRSPVIKFAIAAALVGAVLLGVALFRGSGSGVVWAEVARKVQASRGVSYRSTETIVPDTYNQQSDFSMQYITSTQSRLDSYKEGRIVQTIWGDCNTKTVVLVDHFHKSYVKRSPDEKMPSSLRTADPNNMVQRFLSCKYRELGRKTIAGVLCEGLETTDPAFFGSKLETPVARLWVSVDTRYPVGWESDYGFAGVRHTCASDQFQWDAGFEENWFVPVIPEGYLDISP